MLSCVSVLLGPGHVPSSPCTFLDKLQRKSARTTDGRGDNRSTSKTGRQRRSPGHNRGRSGLRTMAAAVVPPGAQLLRSFPSLHAWLLRHADLGRCSAPARDHRVFPLFHGDITAHMCVDARRCGAAMTAWEPKHVDRGRQERPRDWGMEKSTVTKRGDNDNPRATRVGKQRPPWSHVSGCLSLSGLLVSSSGMELRRLYCEWANPSARAQVLCVPLLCASRSCGSHGFTSAHDITHKLCHICQRYAYFGQHYFHAQYCKSHI